MNRPRVKHECQFTFSSLHHAEILRQRSVAKNLTFASVKTARHGLYLRGCAKRGLPTRSLRACSSASLLRPVNHHDVRVLLYPFEDDHEPVGRDVEVVDNDVATEIG